MFDFEKVREMMNVEQYTNTVNTAVDTAVDQMEAANNAVAGYITDKKAKGFYQAVSEAQYATVRSALSNYRLAAKSISI